MEFVISAATDVGTRKKINQDSLFVRKIRTRAGKMVFAVLCDGMGGLTHGELASASILSAFTEWMYVQLPVLSQKPLEDCAIREQWSETIRCQNDKIRAYGCRNQCAVGSTVTALLMTENRYFLLNIGDTRAYEIGENVVRLTEDHTLAAKEVRLGNMTDAQAEKASIRNVLTRCVGVEDRVRPDMFFGDVRKNTVYMLCSDGFRHCITADEMKEYLLRNTWNDSYEIKQQEERLIELVKRRGETDNISVITIHAG